MKIYLLNMLKKCNYYIFVISGFLLFIIFIYFSFIRERLPKDIPFNLTEYSFWILIYICFIYLLAIQQLLLVKKII